jgi:phosphate transport system substrate-binding protein
MVKKQPNLKLFENGAYPLTRRLFVVIRQDGTPDQLAGEAYAQMLLSNQGQEIVEASGFVPLYNRKL